MNRMGKAGIVLAEVSNQLSELTEDQMTRDTLRANAQRLKLGAVRVAVVGSSNAGKSTLINALLQTIAVPESGNTSSPIPVWFSVGDEVRYSVYSCTEDGVRCDQPDAKTFIKKYCYNLLDIADDKRVRFSDVQWASAEVPSDYLKKTGLTLIDTLGINATEADTVKTNNTIDLGMDVVMFVTGRVDLLDSDLKFLRKHILGYEDQERVVPYPVSPSQLLLVYNDKGMAGATRQQLEASAEKLLKGASPDEIDDFKKNNIIMLNALAARRKRCGAYDYMSFSPAGTLEMEEDALKQKTLLEQQAIETCSAEMQQEAEKFDQLEKRLIELASDMTRKGGAVERRIIHLEEIICSIRKKANDTIGVLQAERSVVQQKINDIADINKTFIKSNKDISPVFDEQRKKMRQAIHKTLEAKQQEATKSLIGFLYQMTKPPEFITPQSMREFNGTTELQKEKILEGWIRTILERNFIPEASKAFKKLLLETTVGDDPNFTVQDTVQYQVEAARRLAMAQSVRMKNFYENVKKKGADDIGLSVPTDSIIEAWFAGMASEMETAILEAIAKLQHEAYQKLNAQMAIITKSIRVTGLLNRIRQFFGSVDQFWLVIRNKAIIPAAMLICTEWFNAEGDMYRGIDDAYERVQKKVVVSLNNQTVQVETYLSKLQLVLQDQQQIVQQATASSNEMEEKLDNLKQKLNDLRLKAEENEQQ